MYQLLTAYISCAASQDVIKEKQMTNMSNTEI